MKKSIAIIAALLCLTSCATTDPQPVETAPEIDTAAETQQIKTGHAITAIRFDIINKDYILGEAAERKRD